MNAPLRSWINSPRPARAWTGVRRNRREWVGATVLLVLAAGMLLLRLHFSALGQTVAWGLWFVAVVALVHRFWSWLFGPVFFYDLLRTTRGGRCFSIRVFYALLLLFILFLVYIQWFGTGGDWVEGLLTGQRVSVKQLPLLAETYFWAFLIVQFGMVVLMTPISSAAAIAEEKERRTLEYVLATELHDREIVLGKLGARVLAMALFVLAGLPVLTTVQFLGGVDPNLILAGYAATFVTMLSAGSLGLVNSCYARKVRGAVFLTYVQMASYLLLSLCCGATVSLGGGWNPLNWVGAGNPYVAFVRLYNELAKSGNYLNVLPEVLRDYTLFHLLLTVVFSQLAVRKLRDWNTEPAFTPRLALEPLEVRPTARRPQLHHRHILPGKPRPRVGKHAMIWKEFHAEPGLGFDRFRRALGPMPLLLGLFWGAYFILAFCLTSMILSSEAGGLSRGFNVLIRTLATPLACLMLLGIALRAAGSLSSERERQTLDALLTTPLTNRSILVAKWLASIMCVRTGFWVLGGLGAIGLVTTGLHPLAVPLVALAWVVYAAVAANLGLYFSLVSRSTLRATLLTLPTFLALVAAPYAFWSTFEAIVRLMRWEYELAWVFDFRADRLIPPVSLSLLMFCSSDFEARGLLNTQAVVEILEGLGVYALFAAVLWGMLVSRFPFVTGRMPVGSMILSRASQPIQERNEYEPRPSGSETANAS